MITNQGGILTFTIPEGAGVPYALNASGRHFALLEANGPVEVKIDSLPKSLLAPGSQLDFDPGEFFERIEFYSPTGAEMLVTVWVGNARYTNTRRANLPSPTRGFARAGNSIPANDEIALPGRYEASDLQRKSIQVSNTDLTLPIQILDAAKNVILYIWPQTSVTLEISTPVYVKNPSATPVSAAISEIIYTT